MGNVALQFEPLNLRVGDWVEVRGVDEILATLDKSLSLDGLPFMPEMLQYCGKRFRVEKSAHKTCDTIESFVIRRMNRVVHLEGLRCDGQAHGGCQAGCLLFWKDSWLKRVSEATRVHDSGPGSGEQAIDLKSLHEATRAPVPEGEIRERYRCQATEVLRATSEVRRRDRWNPLFYLKDLTSGNVGILDFLKYGAFAAFNSLLISLRKSRYPHLTGQAGSKTPTTALHLDAGDLVQVRSKADILRTLNGQLRNRGLSFDVEMVRFCEGTYKVLRRVERIVNEKTGYMIQLPNPCVVLDGVTCSGNLSHCRMFCPRAIYPYWHEVWLKRVEG